jgi:hypothetical protein
MQSSKFKEDWQFDGSKKAQLLILANPHPCKPIANDVYCMTRSTLKLGFTLLNLLNLASYVYSTSSIDLLQVQD